jgi:amino acid transporter
LNIANMVGIGPFITIPTFIAAMNGPQALIAWIIAALVVLCDGLIWSELGAALPGSGGSYHFLREIFGRYDWGRLLPFLFIWQFLVSGAMEMASGYIGAVQYASYLFPRLADPKTQQPLLLARCIAAASALLVAAALCQHIKRVGWLSLVLCAGTLITVLTVIIAGLSNFDAHLLQFPEGAFHLDTKFAKGLGVAMSIAIYDYLGYFNVCHLGDEVRDPGRTIPRAVMISVIVVASIYLSMNVAIIGVVPWQEAMNSKYIASEFMEQLFGRTAAMLFTGLILWTVVACMFAITLGYSRIPYAAATRGDFFRMFSYVHPRGRFPAVSLCVIGVLTAAFCFLDLSYVISAAVAVRILIQFVGQIVGLHILRITRPDVQMPFRMWLYPLPSLIALVGWIFVFCTSDVNVILLSLIVIETGCLAFIFWRARTRVSRK